MPQHNINININITGAFFKRFIAINLLKNAETKFNNFFVKIVKIY
jgi:hypothetical protein